MPLSLQGLPTMAMHDEQEVSTVYLPNIEHIWA